ncbi:hypothetical protein QSJ18_18280 [Gordonia sp. ABSL1-1]|uniref:hypothetical protein n=1 Tax=Gordonia sp. ABSL1-1 TaxID=3053923 RepID=UPI0025743587|nr:hypothetical protein [Gordonia sp. ABSL1-1]MDL9938698.1 hypothetical protein [Gordonia sp. ABSL1-1]
MSDTIRTTRTTEMVSYGGLTLDDLSRFVVQCKEAGWTGAAPVTFHTVNPDRPGERIANTLTVRETR